MKIKIRTLKQEKYEFDITDETTVAELNKMIEDKYQHKASWQILIFSGKQLARENTIKSYNVGENDFLVLMVKKPKDEEETKPTVLNPNRGAATTPSVAGTTPSPPTSIPSSASQPAQAPTSVTAPTQPQIDPITGQNVQSMVDQLVDMGFSRDQVHIALRASFYNMDRAVEYLTNGIPQNIMPVMPTPGSGSAPAPASAPASATASAPGPARPAQPRQVLPPNLIPPGLQAQAQGNPLESLRNNPMLPLLQQIAREDPNRLTEFLGQIAASHPELLRAIVQNRDEFIRLLSGVAPGGVAPGGVAPGGAPGPQHTISVSPEDQEKIGNIMAITSMSRERVMEAYFLFEKDEQLAINYLLNNPNDEAFD